jgi:threonine/homoserine efflux transporter RhtA
LALKAGAWLRRVRFVIVSPDLRHNRRFQAEIPLIPVSEFGQPPQLPPPSAAVWGAFAAIALLCTVLAYVLYFRILATAGATNLLLVTFLLPISALVLGSLILGEHIKPTAFLGMALIGAGLAAIDGRLVAARLRRKKGKKTSFCEQKEAKKLL